MNAQLLSWLLRVGRSRRWWGLRLLWRSHLLRASQRQTTMMLALLLLASVASGILLQPDEHYTSRTINMPGVSGLNSCELPRRTSRLLRHARSRALTESCTPQPTWCSTTATSPVSFSRGSARPFHAGRSEPAVRSALLLLDVRVAGQPQEGPAHDVDDRCCCPWLFSARSC